MQTLSASGDRREEATAAAEGQPQLQQQQQPQTRLPPHAQTQIVTAATRSPTNPSTRSSPRSSASTSNGVSDAMDIEMCEDDERKVVTAVEPHTQLPSSATQSKHGDEAEADVEGEGKLNEPDDAQQEATMGDMGTWQMHREGEDEAGEEDEAEEEEEEEEEVIDLRSLPQVHQQPQEEPPVRMIRVPSTSPHSLQMHPSPAPHHTQSLTQSNASNDINNIRPAVRGPMVFALAGRGRGRGGGGGLAHTSIPMPAEATQQDEQEHEQQGEAADQREVSSGPFSPQHPSSGFSTSPRSPMFEEKYPNEDAEQPDEQRSAPPSMRRSHESFLGRQPSMSLPSSGSAVTYESRMSAGMTSDGMRSSNVGMMMGMGMGSTSPVAQWSDSGDGTINGMQLPSPQSAVFGAPFPAASPSSPNASRSPASLALSMVRRRAEMQPMAMTPSAISSMSSQSFGDDEPTPGLWMAVFRPARDAEIGVAYYTLEDETLYGGQYASIEAVQKLKYKIRPDVIVTTAQWSEELYQQLAFNDLDHRHAYQVKVMKRAEFATESAMQRLRLLQIDKLHGGDGGIGQRSVKQMNTLELSLMLTSVIDFEQVQMVRAMGGLITYLLQSSVFSQLEAGDRFMEPVHLRSIAPIPHSHTLFVDRGTMDALAVFVQEQHPGLANRKKEGFSVFSVLNQTKTNMGSRMLRQWLEHPTTDIDVINQRQDHVQYFTEPSNSVSQH